MKASLKHLYDLQRIHLFESQFEQTLNEKASAFQENGSQSQSVYFARAEKLNKNIQPIQQTFKELIIKNDV